MIIYNVTVNVDDLIADEWEVWMKTTHVPEVMKTGMFVSFTFSKLLTRQDDETGTTYVIQYTAQNMQAYERYVSEFAPALQQQTREKFGDKFIAFRTLMQRIGGS
jgi:hexokinase